MTPKLTDMILFKRVDEGQVIISDRGVYRQVDLYERDNQLFAATRGGFVKLLPSESTSVPHVRWKAIEGVPYAKEFNCVRLDLPKSDPVVTKIRKPARQKAAA